MSTVLAGSEVLLVLAAALFARAKGRGTLLGLLGLLSVPGLVVLALLGTRCSHCDRLERWGGAECPGCGAPLSHRWGVPR